MSDRQRRNAHRSVLEVAHLALEALVDPVDESDVDLLDPDVRELYQGIKNDLNALEVKARESIEKYQG